MDPDPISGCMQRLTAAAPPLLPASFWSFRFFLLLALIVANAFFAASEIALISLNENKIRKLSEEGNKRAEKILAMLRNTSSFLATIQVGVTFAGFLTSAAAAQSFAGPLASYLMALMPGIPASVLYTVSTLAITVVLAFFNLVLGELVPKKIALQKAERLSFAVIGILELFYKAAYPFTKLLSVSTNLILRFMGMDPNAEEQTVTEEEILLLVDAGEDRGLIEESAKDMIANIFEFDDTLAIEVMTHRTSITALDHRATLKQAVDLAIASGYSRIPVYGEDLDTILGILYAKDLLKYVGDALSPGILLESIMRPALFVPDQKKCSELFKEMTENKTQIAIIVDEYGGTAGLVTLEDLVESIVGNIEDEFDHEEEAITQLSENSFLLNGSTSIGDVADLAGIKFPPGDYDTIAGFMVDRLGRIPKQDESPAVEYGEITLSVEQVKDQRISKILLVINRLDETTGNAIP